MTRFLVVGDATVDLDYRHLLGIPPRAFVVGWVGRMTGVKDTGSVLEIVRAAEHAPGHPLAALFTKKASPPRMTPMHGETRTARRLLGELRHASATRTPDDR